MDYMMGLESGRDQAKLSNPGSGSGLAWNVNGLNLAYFLPIPFQDFFSTWSRTPACSVLTVQMSVRIISIRREP